MRVTKSRMKELVWWFCQHFTTEAVLEVLQEVCADTSYDLASEHIKKAIEAIKADDTREVEAVKLATKELAHRIIEVGNFISIPAWSVEGQVIAKEQPITGTEHAQRVLVQSSPDDETGRWYTVEPDEFSLES